MSLAIKRMLVGTKVGRIAMTWRDTYRLWQAPRVEFGTVVNDQIASRLAVAFCPSDGTFVDVGAHIGSIISDVKFRHPSAKVVAFEAIPNKAEALRKKFPSVEIHNVALWDSEGEAAFFVDPQHSGCSSLHRTGSAVQEIRIATRRLDTVLADRPVHIVKIDVEGAELGVLKGATALLAKERPIVMFESGPEDRLGFTKPAMFAFFDEQDYQLFAPNRLAHTGGAMTLDAFLDSHEYPRRTTNYFALPKERAEEIREISRTIAL